MATPLKRESGDTPIRERIAMLAQAIRDKDIDSVMTYYAPDVVVYDLMPPLDVKCATDYRQNFERWFASMRGSIDYQMNDLRVSMGDSLAFCHAVSHIKGTRKNGEKADYWVRLTTCFQKANGQWLIGHEHVSRPTTTM